MYHRHIVAKDIFKSVDHQIWKMLWKWSLRRHHNKNKTWVKNKYFQSYKTRDWVFTATDKDGNITRIFNITNIKIQRHIKIRSQANPFDAAQEIYFEKRQALRMLNKWTGKRLHRFIYDRQKGKCTRCHQAITLVTGWHLHHQIPKHLGGKWNAENLIMLHPVCHIQLHQT